MQIDMAAIGEVIKDKVGRKQIIAITTIVALAWLVNKQADLTVTEPALARMGLILIAVVGIAGITAQSLLDWKRPRTPTQKE